MRPTRTACSMVGTGIPVSWDAASQEIQTGALLPSLAFPATDMGQSCTDSPGSRLLSTGRGLMSATSLC
ncbi:hypothetical protein DDE18_15790 [Nocardioides gansuensis]|uniref:Uncharacterized protein n=1 Tax=Nocardioides gansuensis TaxID=2138300 RepID=A0A2T8F8T4_9ACTN|nr:hypothetical protein DDE18_15790 [Nocardioides gansuensis]